ncbi:MAG: hypothetical protein HY707_08140 [Ignavibacteriae bacterium]|nr:hypothetical protein [Ignavibacteriota bacterium]
METTESCKFCQKIVITLKTKKKVDRLLDLPHTFDPLSGNYTWRFYEFFAYALIPRVMHGRTSQVDLYLCIDEDDLDDIDIFGYAKRFLQERVLSQWNNVESAAFVEPVLARPEDLVCRKLRHFIEEDAD